MIKINKPNNVQIELVRGCNRNCDFCAIDCVPKEKKFMDIDIAKNIAIKIKTFDPIRIEFAMRGEPTLHENLISITKIFRYFNTNSQITLTTNGIKCTKDMAIQFFKKGGNIIIIDCYDKTYNKYIERFNNLPVYDFYSSGISPWHRHPPTTQMILLINDLGVMNKKVKSRVIWNQAGNLNYDKMKKYGLKPLEKPLNKSCVQPFRELIFFYNGDIPFCCRDWTEKKIIENIKYINDLNLFWKYNKTLNIIRTLLYNKNRNFAVCEKCDFNGGARIGLLPKMKNLNITELAKYKRYLD